MSDSQAVARGFAERLKLALTRNGIPDERGRAARVARHIEISHVSVKKWLDGQGLPDLKHQVALAQWLKVSFNWLSAGQGNMEILDVTNEELALISIYRRMDGRGKQTIRNVADAQAQYHA